MDRSPRAWSRPLGTACALLVIALWMATAHAAPAPPAGSPSASASPTASGDPRGYPLPTRPGPTRPPVAHPSVRPGAAPSPSRTPVHASPSLPGTARLRVAVRIAFETRSATQTARGDSEWEYDVERLHPVWSAHGASTYLADGGSWQGRARARGIEKPREAAPFNWYYAFSRRFPLDRVSGVFPGYVDNLTLYLSADPSGRVRYRLLLRGNGPKGGATNDTFPIERHLYGKGMRPQVEAVDGGWVPTLMIGALPGEKSAVLYAPQGAMAGLVVWRRPQFLSRDRRLEGSTAFTHREGATTYRIQVAWSSR